MGLFRLNVIGTSYLINNTLKYLLYSDNLKYSWTKDVEHEWEVKVYKAVFSLRIMISFVLIYASDTWTILVCIPEYKLWVWTWGHGEMDMEMGRWEIEWM